VGPLGLGSPRFRAALNPCPALRLRWIPTGSPCRQQDCCLPVTAHRRLSVRLPEPILLSTTIHFSEFNTAACVLASPLLRTPPLGGRPSVRLPAWWLAFGRMGLESSRPLTHWVILMSFKGYHPYSLVPDLSRHDHRLVRSDSSLFAINMGSHLQSRTACTLTTFSSVE
jgi:hypothetical protein